MQYPENIEIFIEDCKTICKDLKHIRDDISNGNYIDASFMLGAIWNDYHDFLIHNCEEYKKNGS